MEVLGLHQQLVELEELEEKAGLQAMTKMEKTENLWETYIFLIKSALKPKKVLKVKDMNLFLLEVKEEKPPILALVAEAQAEEVQMAQMETMVITVIYIYRIQQLYHTKILKAIPTRLDQT